MHELDLRAMRRAALLLLATSALRWAGTVRGPAPEPPAPEILETLLDSSSAALEEARERTRPLAAGERVDPNRADEATLDRLPGVGPATARGIVEARSVQPFHGPADMERVAGIGPATVARLAPFLDFPDPPRTRPPRSARAPAPAQSERLDVSRASAGELEALPGVGPALARRIIDERAARPFRTVEDLLRVRGIGPATLDRLRARVRVGR